MTVYKRTCSTCGNDNENRIVSTKFGYEICLCCGGSIFDISEVDEDISSDETNYKALLAFQLQQETLNIF